MENQQVAINFCIRSRTDGYVGKMDDGRVVRPSKPVSEPGVYLCEIRADKPTVVWVDVTTEKLVKATKPIQKALRKSLIELGLAFYAWIWDSWEGEEKRGHAELYLVEDTE